MHTTRRSAFFLGKLVLMALVGLRTDQKNLNGFPVKEMNVDALQRLTNYGEERRDQLKPESLILAQNERWRQA